MLHLVNPNQSAPLYDEQKETSIINMVMPRLRAMAFKMHDINPANEVEDYMQVGSIAVVIEIRKQVYKTLNYLCVAAHHAMITYANKNRPEASLDAWMYDEDTDMHRDIEDVPQEYREASLKQRMLVNKLLSHLNRRDQAVVRAYYGIGDAWGRPTSPEGIQQRWQLTKQQFGGVRGRAVRRMTVMALSTNLQYIQ